MTTAPGGVGPQVWEDHASLKGQLDGSQTRYTIALRGELDDRWAEAFRIVQKESPVYLRFELDRASSSIRFSCRTVDGAVLVFDVLERLEKLLKNVNERVEFWRTQNPAVGGTLEARGVA